MSNEGSAGSEGNFREQMTVRQWISKPKRLVDRVESLHIFRQILEFVDVAHLQCVSLRNIRPSYFILSAFNRVAFIESAGTRSSSDRSSERSTGRHTVPRRLGLDEDDSSSPSPSTPLVSVRQDSQISGGGPEGRQPGANLAHGRGYGHGQRLGDGARMEQTSATFNREAEYGAGDPLVRPGLDDPILEAWERRDFNNAGFVQEWSGSSGLELSPDEGALAGARSVQASVANGRSDAVGGTSGMRNTSQDLFRDEEEMSQLQEERFPQKQLLLREQTWYASPEELVGATASFAADIYCLGVLFFELICTFATEAERLRAMSDLRHRILPPRLLSECPKEAAFCLWLLHPDPNSRPQAREVIQCELLSEAEEALAERQAAVGVEERAAESDLLLEFLYRMQHNKQDATLKLNQDVTRLTSDIGEVERRRSSPKQSEHLWNLSDPGHRGIAAALPGSVDRVNPASVTEDLDVRVPIVGKTSLATGFNVPEGKRPTAMGKRPREKIMVGVSDGDISAKSVRLMNNFAALEKAYFSMRWQVDPSDDESIKVSAAHKSQGGVSSSVGNTASNSVVDVHERPQGRGNTRDLLGCFFDSLCKYARYSRFEVRATLSHGDLLNTANMICSLSFDRDEEYFATAGLCKRIKIFDCDAVLNERVDIHCPVVEMTSGYKLSSVCWNSYIKSHLASSDYEGIVQLWDANTSQILMQYEEHDRRAWSVDFSRADPTKLASGSDDGCVKLWSINQETSIGTIKTRANVCCVQFPPDSSHLFVFGSADYKIYCYDLRTTKLPLYTLASHNKAVSYVKFVDPLNLVSASTDNTLKSWDLTKPSTNHGVNVPCSFTYTGHLNEKNFVGLSIADGYIACGSEDNSVFVYQKSLPMPMASHKFGCADPITGQETEDDNGQLVSSVCWRGKSQTLVTANSTGNIKILEMV